MGAHKAAAFTPNTANGHQQAANVKWQTKTVLHSNTSSNKSANLKRERERKRELRRATGHQQSTIDMRMCGPVQDRHIHLANITSSQQHIQKQKSPKKSPQTVMTTVNKEPIKYHRKKIFLLTFSEGSGSPVI